MKKIIFGILIIAGLYLLTFVHYLLFHVVAELYSIVIAVIVSVIALNSRRHIKNKSLLFLGISYFFIAIIDLMHTLTFTGMPILTHLNYPANQLWIAGRFFEALVLLIAFGYYYKHTFKIRNLLIIESIITLIILISILVLDIFPACFIEGSGQTLFKLVSEYMIIGILGVTLYIVLKGKRFTYEEKTFYGWAIIFTILSELAFTFYISNYGISNFVGHISKIVSFYFIYRFTIDKGIKEPFALYFKEVENRKNALLKIYNTDHLTGLDNRHKLAEFYSTRKVTRGSMVAMIDLDNFKDVNDNYSHLIGDKVLKLFADRIQGKFQTVDIICRWGGEEFLIVSTLSSLEYFYSIIEEFIAESKDVPYMVDGNEIRVTCSIGITCVKEDLEFDDVINQADEALYKAKNKGKSTYVIY